MGNGSVEVQSFTEAAAQENTLHEYMVRLWIQCTAVVLAM